jgi:GT2 family glycosyltransferase
MTKLAIVILNWNGKKFLEKFLPSVIQNSKNQGVSIIVADNNSSDDSIKFMKENYKEIELIEQDKNYGFAGGYNQALKKVKAEYYLLLNSDIEVTENWLTPLIHFMDNHKDAGACMPKVLSYHKKDEFEHAGASGGFIDKFGYPFCRGRILDHMEKDNGQYDTNLQIFWATGACLLIRAELFHKAGGFDDDFFAHMEEIDLCWRIQLMGYKLFCIPESKIYHVGGGSLPYNSPFKVFLNFRNNLFMLFKNLPDKEFKRKLFARLLLDGVASLMFLLKMEFKSVRAVLKAHKEFWASIKSLRKKRKKVKELKTIEISNIYTKSVIFDFYLRGKKTYNQQIK